MPRSASSSLRKHEHTGLKQNSWKPSKKALIGCSSVAQFIHCQVTQSLKSSDSDELPAPLSQMAVYINAGLSLNQKNSCTSLHPPPTQEEYNVHLCTSVWVVWPSELQMGQTELVESRLDFCTGHVFPLQLVSLR